MFQGNNMLNKFLILYILFPLVATSRVLDAELRKLHNRPELAKTISAGYVEENFWGKQTFHSVRGWTHFPAKIDLERVLTPLGSKKRGKEGEWYIFYSNKPTNSRGEIGKDKFIGLLPLNSDEAYLLIQKLSTKDDFVGALNSSWQYCLKNEDCVKYSNPCKEVVPLNKKFINLYEEYLKGNSCKPSKSNVAEEKKLACLNYFCSF